MKRIYFDMDGTLTEWRTVQREEELFRQGYFLSLRPNPSVIRSACRAMERGAEVRVLSCVPEQSRYALEEKKEWLRRYAPFFGEDRLIFVPYGQDKADYLRRQPGVSCLTAEDILVDDYSVNLFGWEKLHGTGIKLMNGVNGTKGTWQGRRIFAETAESELTELVSGFSADREAVCGSPLCFSGPFLFRPQ